MTLLARTCVITFRRTDLARTKALVARPWFWCACILLVYFAFLTKTYYWDGVLFSLEIENVYEGKNPAATLFHPNHLIYTAFGYGVFWVAKWMALGVRALRVLQCANVLVSTLAGVVLFRLAGRIISVRGIPFFCWLLFAAGATWWKFSTDANTYIICVLLLLLSALCLFWPKPRFVLAASCHTLAMLFHELAIFTYVPVIALILIDATKPVSKRLRSCIAYCVGTGSVVTGAYLLCYSQANHRTYPTLLSWVTSYASNSGFTRSVSQIIGLYFTSYLKLFGGGKLSMVREFFSILECASLLLCVALLIWAIWVFTKRGEPNDGKIDQRGLLFLWTWFLAYAVFLGSWDPGSAFHKLFVWPPIVLLVGAYLAKTHYTRAHVTAFTVLAGALAAWNFGAFIYPRSHTAADPVLALAEKLNRELPKNATIYYRFFDTDDWYLAYFAPGREWKALPTNTDAGSFVRSDNGTVCLETTALEGFQGAIDASQTWQLVDGGHNIRLACLNRP